MNADEVHGPTLVEDSASPNHTIAHAEQQALLAAWQDAEQVDEKNESRNTSSAAKQRRFLAIVLVGFSFAFLVATGLILTLGTVSNDFTSNKDSVQRQPSYVLSPQWDIHAKSQTREFDWTIRDHLYNPDGVYRPMILVNNQFPGPLIEANEGDRIVVHVSNQAVNSTSIHWHGIYQNGSSYMDGTVGVTQCPIAPGGRFTYEFTVSGQSGTYWWHGHHGVQASDGLYGPLIIHSRRERNLQKIDYSTDRILMISDHYHDLSSALLWQYLKPDMENTEPVPDSGLINGQTVVNCDLFQDRKCDNETVNVGTPAFDFERGQRHRIRFINVGAFAEFQIQVDEHELAVTEVDGTDVDPVHYHRINISPAQRYSVVLHANNPNAQSYWMRARMVTTCFTDPPDTLQSEVRGLVRYKNNGRVGSLEFPTSMDWQERPGFDCKDMNVSDLKPVEVVAAPAKPDAFFYIRSNFEIGAYRLSRGFFNGSSWRPNVRSPSLLRAVDGMITGNESYLLTAASSPLPSSAAFINNVAFDESRELVIQTNGIQTVDLLISNFDDGNHPLHLHGYKYFVLAQGHGYPPLVYPGAYITFDNLSPLYTSLDLSNPLRRDTASVEAFGWTLLRVVADNPGMWAFHCHVSWHSEAGLLMQFLTRSDQLANMSIPTKSLELCRAEGLEKGMAPEDAVYKDLAK